MTNQPPALATVTLSTTDGPLTVVCEPVTDVIVITPDFGMSTDFKTFYSGAFKVTHAPTGTMLSEGVGCIECCRHAAKELAALDVDWASLTNDNSRELMAALTQETRDRIAMARAVEWLCDAELCRADDNVEAVAS